MNETRKTLSSDFRVLHPVLLAASIALFILIVLGGIVRATGAGSACPDWPTCFGVWTPTMGSSLWINYSHRVMSLVAGLLVLSAAYLAWRRFRAQRWLTNWLTFAVGLLITQVLLGALIATGAIPQAGGWTTAIHLGYRCWRWRSFWEQPLWFIILQSNGILAWCSIPNSPASHWLHS